MSKVVELFGIPTNSSDTDWPEVVNEQRCPYLQAKCLKNRKSTPEIAIGSCTVMAKRRGHVVAEPVMICPYRLLERRQVFTDCIHLLTLHEPGNELHVVPEVTIPGGSVDYFLVSTRHRKVRDFVGIEFQTLDTTGTVWPERQRFLAEQGIEVNTEDAESSKPFGMNWKMTAKTILVQLHHKIATFEYVGKHLVLAIQDPFLGFLEDDFKFDHLEGPLNGNPMHIHSYGLVRNGQGSLNIQLTKRLSTDTNGIAACLGLQAEANVELETIVAALEDKLSDDTLMNI